MTISNHARRDAAAWIADHAEDNAYFSLDSADGAVLEVQHVCWGAEGFFCRWIPAGPGEAVAIGRGRHGLALAYDGGGNPWVIDSACAVDRDTAIAVVARFMDDGGRSEAVAWGAGIVDNGLGWEEGWVLHAIGEPGGPGGWLPGGYRGQVGGPVEPSLVQTASWRVIEHVDVDELHWLAFIAEHPMPRLRRLEIEAGGDSLAALPAVLASSPELEELVITGAAVLELPPLVSPSLRQLWLAAHGPLDDEEPPADWETRIAGRLARCDLPNLRAVHIAAVTGYSD